MAYVAPTTANAVAGSAILASDMLTVMNDIIDHEAYVSPLRSVWTSYTPTLSQGATTNITKTVTYAKYVSVGKTVYGSVRLEVTGTGTTNNDIYINPPVSPTWTSVTALAVGFGWYYDSSTGTLYNSPAVLSGSSFTLAYGVGGAIGRVPNIPAGASDQFAMTFSYEAA